MSKFNVEKNPKTMSYVLERIQENKRCNKCGSILLKSDLKDYSYQCMNCDEDLYKFEAHDGEDRTDKELEEILENTRDLLELDNITDNIKFRHLIGHIDEIENTGNDYAGFEYLQILYPNNEDIKNVMQANLNMYNSDGEEIANNVEEYFKVKEDFYKKYNIVGALYLRDYKFE